MFIQNQRQAQKCEYGIERENKTWISQVYAKLYELGCFRGRNIGESIGPTLPYSVQCTKRIHAHNNVKKMREGDILIF